MRNYYEESERPLSATIKTTLFFATLPVACFAVGTVVVIAASVAMLKTPSRVLGASTYSLYVAEPKDPTTIKQSFSAEDSRSAILDNYFSSQGAPLSGQGKILVALADKYSLDWRLVPAIAMQESNGGKVMPRESFNAWGWAIYTGKNSGAYFDSWEHAIETVSKGLAKYRDSYGLITPEQIMQLYTPDSAANGGSWARGVRYFMDIFEAGQS